MSIKSVNTTTSIQAQNTSKSAQSTGYIIQYGDTAWAISKKLDIPLDVLQAANPGVDLNKIKPNQVLNTTIPTKNTPKPAQSTGYTIQHGDTAWAISKKLGVSFDVLQAANPGVDLNKIKPGQVLNTSCSSTTPQAGKSTSLSSASIFGTEISNETLLPTFSATSKKTVMLDAGHGQPNKNGLTDPGTVNGDAKESNITQTAVTEIKKELEKMGFNVVLGKRDSLKNRQKEKIKINPDYYLSIHVNSAENKTASGEEVLYAGSDDKAFATTINDKLDNDNTIPKNRGVKHRPGLAVLKKDPEKTKSALIELGFLSNDKDKNVLTNNELLKKQAKLIASGIKTYDNNENITTATKNQIVKKPVEKENEISST